MKRKSPSDRVKATRIRKLIAEGEATEDDEAWLNEYESGVPGGIPIDAGPVNASASERITYTEERAAAQGDHIHPEAYAGIARAEGLRADTLLRICTDRIIECNDQYRLLAQICLERTVAIETAHVQILDAIREERLARVDAEVETRMAEMANDMAGGDDEMKGMIQMAIAAWNARNGGGQQGQVAGKGKKPAAIPKKRAKVKDKRALGTID